MPARFALLLLAVTTSLASEATTTRIRDIQGAAHLSPLRGQSVASVPGVVTALGSDGFWMQEPGFDADLATSEGIFVYTDQPPSALAAWIEPGCRVQVDGTVAEFRPDPERLSVTEIAEPTLHRVRCGLPLPRAMRLGLAGRAPPDRVIDDDGVGSAESVPPAVFDPLRQGIDFFESLEGMRVRVVEPRVVGPTNRFGELWVVGENGAAASVLSPRGALVARWGDRNPERIQLDDSLLSGRSPPLDVGSRIAGPVTGVLHYSFGNYELLATEPLSELPGGGVPAESTPLLGYGSSLTVATSNLDNLAGNAPEEGFAAHAAQIALALRSPDLLVLEELQDDDGPRRSGRTSAATTLERLQEAITSAGGPRYEALQIDPEDGRDGGQPGANIRVAMLFDPSRLALPFRPGGDASTPARVVCDSGRAHIEPNPARIEPANPAFERSRKPLAAELRFRRQPLYVVGLHFVSKRSDGPLFGWAQPPRRRSEPKRALQAEAVARFCAAILSCDPTARIVVAGDANDFEFSDTLAILERPGLSQLAWLLPPAERYSFVFDGNAQLLDTMLASQALFDGRTPELDIVHLNAEFAVGRVSDHDPLVARFDVPTSQERFALRASADGFVQTRARDRNTGAGARLRVEPGGRTRSLVAFDLSGIERSRVVGATLVLRTAAPARPHTRAPSWRVDAHALAQSFVEGSGDEARPGRGPGATWHCAADADIANGRRDCTSRALGQRGASGRPRWLGGDFSTDRAASALHFAGLDGEVAWEVGEDVRDGTSGWLLRSAPHQRGGSVAYHSREGSLRAFGDLRAAPLLLLELDCPTAAPWRGHRAPPRR